MSNNSRGVSRTWSNVIVQPQQRNTFADQLGFSRSEEVLVAGQRKREEEKRLDREKGYGRK